jgi:trans-2-enoyl-CoA reductase
MNLIKYFLLFLFHLFGFNYDEIDYTKETEEVVDIAGLQ